GLRPRDGRLLALGHAGRGRRADRARRAGGQARTAGPPAAGTPEDRRRTAAAPARARREPGRDPGRAAAAGRRRAAMTRDEWLSAARLVELRLPALPSDKGALSRLSAREHWRGSPLAREVDGVWEYHRSLLPAEAQAELLARDLAANETPSRA